MVGTLRLLFCTLCIVGGIRNDLEPGLEQDMTGSSSTIDDVADTSDSGLTTATQISADAESERWPKKTLHISALKQKPGCAEPFDVKKCVSWGKKCERGYQPVHCLLAKKDEPLNLARFKDPDDLTGRIVPMPNLADRSTYETGSGTLKELLFKDGIDALPGLTYPLNPVGRTGTYGRGLLWKWGPNHAADPIVTRKNPDTGKLQLVVIKRQDTGAWALPGGMVDPGETTSVTVKREFKEEAGNVPEEARALFERLIDELFASPELVYTGYVDDPRNTDNSWMETAAYHFHCNDELGPRLPLHAGDDAVGVKWGNVEMNNDKKKVLVDGMPLYASHGMWVLEVAKKMESKGVPPIIKRM